MNVRLNYTLSFTAGVYYNDTLHMNNYNLTLWMLTNSADPNDHEVSFDRIQYFVNNILHSTIFINSDNREKCQQFVQAGLDITSMPGDPVDQLVGIMLYQKLNAITEGRLLILETEISSQVGSGMVYLHGEHENTTGIVPPEWWNAADLSHCDNDLNHQDKVLTLHQINTWRELDLGWPDSANNTPDDNTVVFANFKKDETE